MDQATEQRSDRWTERQSGGATDGQIDGVKIDRATDGQSDGADSDGATEQWSDGASERRIK